MTKGNAKDKRAALVAGIGLILYAGALAARREIVPSGLNNDVAEEALRGMALLGSGRFEPITTVIGNSAETLYLYLEALSVALLSPTTLALQALSGVCGILCIVFLVAVARRVDPAIPVHLPLLAGATSVWLFHYSRAGLRAIAAPLFLLAFTYFLLGSRESRREALAAGAVLGFGIYAYTAFRIVPIAWVLWVAFELWRSRDRKGVLRSAAFTAAAALVISLPNLLYAMDHPREFFLRGSYALQGGLLRNLGATLLLPFGTLDSYDAIAGPHHFFDGVAVSLTLAGIHPLHPLVTLAALVGLVSVLRSGAARFPLFVLATGFLLLGATGPSLTRLLVLLPVVLLLAALGAARLPVRLALALFALVAVSHGHSYFSTFASDAEAQRYFSPAATPIGNRARALAAEGTKVLCVVSKDASVARYLTHGLDDRTRVVELSGPRPTGLEDAFFGLFGPARGVVLLDSSLPLAPTAFPGFLSVLERGPFKEIRIGPRQE